MRCRVGHPSWIASVQLRGHRSSLEIFPGLRVLGGCVCPGHLECCITGPGGSFNSSGDCSRAAVSGGKFPPASCEVSGSLRFSEPSRRHPVCPTGCHLLAILELSPQSSVRGGLFGVSACLDGPVASGRPWGSRFPRCSPVPEAAPGPKPAALLPCFTMRFLPVQLPAFTFRAKRWEDPGGKKAVRVPPTLWERMSPLLRV